MCVCVFTYNTCVCVCVAVVVVESAAVVSSARPSPLNTKTRWEFQAKNARRCRSVPVFRALLLVPQPVRPLRRRALASCARRDIRLHRRRRRRNDRFLQLLSTCCTRCFIVLSAACFIINYYAIRQQYNNNIHNNIDPYWYGSRIRRARHGARPVDVILHVCSFRPLMKLTNIKYVNRRRRVGFSERMCLLYTSLIFLMSRHSLDSTNESYNLNTKPGLVMLRECST